MRAPAVRGVSLYLGSHHAQEPQEPERVAELLSVLLLESSGTISAGSGAMGQLSSDAVYEYIETVPMEEGAEESAASQGLVQDEDYDDAEEPENSPAEDVEAGYH